MSELTFTYATLEDVDSIDGLQNISNDTTLTKEIIKQNIVSNGTYLLLKKENELLAFLSFDLLYDHIDLCNLLVHPNHRKKGLASLLLIELEQIAKQKHILDIFLEVSVSNLNAVHLYEKNSYLAISTRKHYYPNGDHAIIMKKTVLL